MGSIVQRLSNIEYQLLKNITWTPTDEQLVAMTQSILTTVLQQAEDDGEDLLAQQGDFPTTFLGTTIDWDDTNPEGDSFTITNGDYTVTQDADNPKSTIVDTEGGLDDEDRVLLDKNELTIEYAAGEDASGVESDITLPGGPLANGSGVTWDASNHSAISNDGTVTQPSPGEDNITGTIRATLTLSGNTAEKIFSITVLAPTSVPFITTWQTDATGTKTVSSSDQVKLPLKDGGTYDFTVQWGDGQSDTITAYDQVLDGETDPVTHTYASTGTYDITIEGTCEGWGFWYNGEDNSKLTGIKQWGNVKLHNNGFQLIYCDISSYTATDTLDTSNITSMASMFTDTTLPTGFDISGWDTSGVTNMSGVFDGVTLPDGFDISGWNTSSVTTMNEMFYNATLPTGFDISGWNTSSVTNMTSIFQSATLPSGFDISGWDTSSVTNMNSMFINATLPSGFDISIWDTSSVTNMENMFYNTTFNGNIGSWITSSVTDMTNMFNSATSFNRNISGWDVSNVTDMSYMFSGATAFNQDLGGWGISSVTDMTGMFDNCGLSTANYDATLIGWSGLGTVPSNITLGAAGIQYSSDAADERDFLVTNQNWTINDAGEAPSSTAFITTWQTDATGTKTVSSSDQVKLPLDSGGTYDFTVNWGDGQSDTITAYDQAEVTHTYASAGTYDITIEGTCEGWGFANSGEDNSKLKGIKSWGNVKLHDNGHQFYYCDISSYTATDVLDTSNITDMQSMFQEVTLPTGFDISGWNTSSIINMDSMFGNATLPTGFDISGWTTSSVTDMNSMFSTVTLPSGFDISGWTTSSVTDMYGMFASATLPDGFDISGWDTSSVTNMDLMFFTATLPDPFDLSGWCVTNITSEPAAGFETFNGTTQLKPIWGTCP